MVSIESEAGGPIEVHHHHLLYVPAVLGTGRVHFVDRTREVSEEEDFALLGEPPAGARMLTWEQAQSLELDVSKLRQEPEEEAYFDELPESINESPEFTALKGELEDYLYHNSGVTLLYSPVLKVYSKPKESERDFRMRLQQIAREKRDEEIDEITERYEKKLDTLEDRLRREEADLAQREADVTARKRETLVSVGESVVGVFLGRRSYRMASTALSKQRQAAKAKLQLEEAREEVKDLEEDTKELEEELEEKVAAIRERWEGALTELEDYDVKPRRQDVQIGFFGLAWTPHWDVTYQDRAGATHSKLVEAF